MAVVRGERLGAELCVPGGQHVSRAQDLLDAFDREWLREVEPLAQLATKLQELVQLIGPFDALGLRAEVEDPGELDDGGCERRSTV